MTLAAGTRLGPYEILAPIGAGGMGEVYRARDTRLGRDVAIKVLPAEFASDPERLKRFEREARSASSLNHPNIVTTYDVGSSGSVSYIAMEFVDGRPLRARLEYRVLPVREILQIAVQVADGLAKAHALGIVHRDLKPENVMVTEDRLVKILDFGLAKLTQPDVRGGEATQGPTVSGATEPGILMGTVGYMSPEQALGKSVDFRSDQFSFGTILYEMTTGRRAFAGASPPQTLAAIIQDEPEPISALNAKIPAPVRWIVERCLSKEPRGRYASTEDLARELASVRDHLSEASISGAELAPAAPRRRSRLLVGVFVLTLVALAGAALRTGMHLGKSAQLSFRQLSFRRGYVGSARFAPDGQTIVYSPAWEGRPPEIYTTRPESPESRALGLPGFLLSVSSLGEMALSEKTGTLAVAPLGGGAPREVLARVFDADWAPDGKSLAIVHLEGGKKRLEYPIGKILYETTNRLDYLHVSRKGDLIAIREVRGQDFANGTVVLVDRQGKKTTPGIRTSEFAWSPKGDELWFLNQQFDRGESELRAADLEGRQRSIARLPGNFQLDDVSPDGRLLLEHLYERGEIRCQLAGEKQPRSLAWLDLSWAADLSDDGKVLLIHELHRGGVYLRKTDGSQAVGLGQGTAIALSPDGAWVLALRQTSPPNLILLPTGPGETKVLKNDGFESYGSGDWLPDGKRVLFEGTEPGHRARLYLMDIASERVRAITSEGIAQAPPSFHVKAVSPDGKSVFARGGEGRGVYFVEGGRDSKPRPIPGLVDTDDPIGWTADGTSLYVQDERENALRVFRVNLASGMRELVFEFTPLDPAGFRYSTVHVTPDGKSWAYSYVYTLADLYLVEGLKPGL